MMIHIKRFIILKPEVLIQMRVNNSKIDKGYLKVICLPVGSHGMLITGMYWSNHSGSI